MYRCVLVASAPDWSSRRRDMRTGSKVEAMSVLRLSECRGRVMMVGGVIRRVWTRCCACALPSPGR